MTSRSITLTKVMNARGMMGQRPKGTQNKMNTFMFKFISLSSKFSLTHHSSHVQNFCYLWHIDYKLHSLLDKNLFFLSENIIMSCVTILKILIIYFTGLFSETPVEYGCFWANVISSQVHKFDKYIQRRFNYL